MTEQHPTTLVRQDRRIVEAFRAGGGTVDGTDLVLLTTVDAATGRPDTSPATYLRDGDRIVAFAAGAEPPAWYRNLLADPQVTLEVGEGGQVRTYAAQAVPLGGEERDRLTRLRVERDPSARDEPVAGVAALTLLNLAGNPERNRAIGAQLTRHHDALRNQLAGVRSAVGDLLAGKPVSPGAGRPALPLGDELLGHCLTFCYGLHLHHTRENGAFTAFEEEFPHLAPVVDRLRAEHRQVAATLEELEALLARPTSAADVDGFRAELERLSTSLEEHFTYEEEQLLPALGATPA